jgi:hypothetical protein
MSPISQPKIGRVLYSGKIDGGASRALEMPDGSLKIETWGPDGWAVINLTKRKPGGGRGSDRRARSLLPVLWY